MLKLLPFLFIASAFAGCPNDCSGHGSCNVYSACECYRNWMGADCSERVCYFGLAFVDTPAGDLNSDGFISSSDAVESRYSNSDQHEIYPWYAGWGGTHYEVFSVGDDNNTNEAGANAHTTGFLQQIISSTGSQRGEAHFYKECSNKGVCNRQTGQCECFPGFTGEGCSRTACANDCSGHGTCKRLVDSSNGNYAAWDAYATQECICDPGYFGADCSLRSCPKGDDPVTKYTGFTRIKLKSPSSTTDTSWYDTTCLSGLTNAGAAQNAHDETSTFGPSPRNEVPSVDYVKRIWSHDIQLDFMTDCNGTGNNLLCMGWNAWYCQMSNSVGHISGQTAGGFCNHPVFGEVNAKTCLQSEFNTESGNAENIGKDGTNDPTTIAATYKDAVATDNDPTNYTAHSSNVLATGSGTTQYEVMGKIAANASSKIRADLCDHSNAKADTACSGSSCATALCQQSPVKYRAGPSNKEDDLMNSAAIATHKMIVTGTHSAATGRMTKGGCDGRTCNDLDFWSLYLKDVSGEFQRGDALRIDATDADGRRTFGFELCNFIDDISTFYSSSSATNVQTDETQLLEISFPGLLSLKNSDVTGNKLDGYVALEFTDELGDTWMTEGVRVRADFAGSDATTPYATSTSGCSSSNSDTYSGSNTFEFSQCDGLGWTHAQALATDLQNALEALPNQVVPDVQVEFEQNLSSISKKTTETRVFSISFVSNSGNIPKMNVAYSFTNKRSASETWMSTNAACQGGDYGDCMPFFGSASATQEAKRTELVMDSSLPASSARIVDMDYNGTFGKVYLDGTTPTLVSKGGDGSKESVECSNRGLCDHATGLCRCFTGFTKEDCSQQNSLAMG